MKNNKGFSLVELIIVIAIMAILIGVLAPQYIKYVEKSRRSADEDSAESLLETAHVMISDEEWFQALDAGCTISFSNDGVQTSNSSMDSALDEYYSKWRSVKVKSKIYRGKTYKIEFSSASKGLFAIKDGWE